MKRIFNLTKTQTNLNLIPSGEVSPVRPFGQGGTKGRLLKLNLK